MRSPSSTGASSLVTNSGGLPEAIRHDIDGFIYPLKENEMPDDVLFINKIINLYENQDRIIEMGNNSRRRAIDIFSNSAMLKKYSALLSD